MMKSGVPLAQSLGTLALQTKNKSFIAILRRMEADVEKGDSFAQALSQHQRYFSEVYVSMVAAGEASGKLEKILFQLSVQLKKERVLIAKIRTAMTYPIIVIIAMLLIGIAMIVFVIPKITDIYIEAKAQLPLPTRILIGISGFVIHNGILTVLALILLLIILRLIVKTTRGKRTFHALILSSPIASSIIKKIHIARFTRTLQSLLQTDIPIVQSFQIIERTLSNVFYQEAMHQAAEALKKGVTVADALKQHPKLFPPMVLQMIAVGEERGKLDERGNEITTFY